MLALCRFLDSFWQELIGHQQAVATTSHEGCLAMKTELLNFYEPMEAFVEEYINRNPQQVPVFVSVEHFLNENLGADENEQVNEDGIPLDLVFPDN